VKCTKITLELKAQFENDSPYEIKIDINNPTAQQLEGVKESVIFDIDKIKSSN